MKHPLSESDAESSLALRAAWLHFIGGLTQTDVAKRLGLSSVKTHRLIARVVAEGAVKVSIEGGIIECVELEAQLRTAFGLQECRVAPDLGEQGLPLRALGMAGAEYLRSILLRESLDIIGLGHGRTLFSMIQHLPRTQTPTVCFVSLLGCLTRNYALNPHDVMHLVAEKTRANTYMMPVPFFANTPEDREVLLAQRGVGQIFRMAREATLKVVGIGTVEPATQLVEAGMIDQNTMADIAKRGGEGEILGHFVNKKGEIIDTLLTDRTLSIPLGNPHKNHIVALAGGENKVNAIHAVLNSRLLQGLITDERTAKALLNFA